MANLFFSDQTVSEVRNRSSIIEVVSDYISLKKAGRNYRGLCPFHSEKTPSFMVNEEKQIYHCFGCGAGGDVFTFLMKAGDFSFPEAVAEVAKRYGISLPIRELSSTQKKEAARREAFFQINEAAAGYFHDLLTRRKEGHEAREYLSRRGISQEIIREYRLGCSLEQWDGLIQHLREKKLSLETGCELGLILPKKREGWYDCFRGRILFPIFDVHHRVVGFGGRLIKEGQPKYLNSPESPIYHKGELLYGLSVAKRFIQEKDRVIIVEGYFDLLALHQVGWKNSVATLGTALTPHHVASLRRYTSHVITVFDGDAAGHQATLRSLPLFLEQDVSARTALLPKGEDPDSFMRKGKAEDFERRLAEGVSVIEYFFDWLMKTCDKTTIEGRVKIAQEGIALVGRIPDVLRRNFYIKILAERLDLPESSLQKMAGASPDNRARAEKNLKSQWTAAKFPKSEELLVRLMIHEPEVIPSISRDGVLKEFESPVLRKIAEELESLYQGRNRVCLPDLLGRLEEGEREGLSELAFEGSGLEGGDREKILGDCVKKIRARGFMRDRTELLKRIRESEKQGGEKGLDALLLERQELTRKEKDLRENSSRKA